MNPDDLPPQPPRKGKFKPVLRPRRVPAQQRKPGGDNNGGPAGSEIPQRSQEVNKNPKVGDLKNASTPSDKPNETATAGNSGNENAHCSPTPEVSAGDIVSSNSFAASTKKIKKDYVESCNYEYITLPLRPPNSSDPDILNELEFGENQNTEPNKRRATAAEELGLLENQEKPVLMFVQLPPGLPIPIPTNSARQTVTHGSSIADPSTKRKERVTNGPPIQGRVPGGYAGKMLVYESGKVKLDIGGTLFDVSPGMYSESMIQDVVGMNTKETTFCEVGHIEKKMVVTPDFDLLLKPVSD